MSRNIKIFYVICRRYRTLFGVIHFISFSLQKTRCCCRRFVLLLQHEKVTSLLSRILVPTQQAETFFHSDARYLNFFKLCIIYNLNSCMILLWLLNFIYKIFEINSLQFIYASFVKL